jgi:hypothetical protein
MAKITRIEVNCETGEEKVIELTASEIAELEKMQARAEADRVARETEATAKAAAKESANAKLVALGLTAEEIAALTK